MQRDALLAVARERTPAWLAILEELVSIDSPSGHLEGLALMGTRLRERWTALGLEVQERTTEHGPVLVGRSRADGNPPGVLLVGHVDTVFPVGAANQRRFRVVEDRALGPGVADAKGGLVAMLAAYELAVLDGGSDPSVTVVLNADEEIGSPSSRDVITDLASEAAAALIFEPGRPDGSFVVERGGSRRYRIDVHGKAAHTGVDPESGASAVVALGHKILGLTGLTNLKQGRLVNVGIIEGGSRPNIVPDSASAIVDVRYPDPAALMVLEAAIRSIAAESHVPGTSGECSVLTDRPPMVPGDLTRRLAAAYEDEAARLNVRARSAASAGGSDGNFTAAAGAATIDAVGPVGGGFHTADEYLVVPSLAERATLAALVLQLVRRLSQAR